MVEVTQAEIDAVDEMDDALGFLTEVERPILARAFARHAEQACIAERERCARVAEDWTMDWTRESAHIPSDIAQAIRSTQ